MNAKLASFVATGFVSIVAAVSPRTAHAGIPVTIDGTSGDDEIELIDGVLTLNGGPQVDLGDILSDEFAYDVTINGSAGNDYIIVDGLDALADTITFTINGGDGEDNLVNYDSQESVTVVGGGGIDACAENVVASQCETDVDLAGLGMAWDYDASLNEFTIWGTNGADQIAVFNIFTFGVYLFNGTPMGLGDVLFDYGNDVNQFPIDSLVIRGRRGADEIWVMPNAHADHVTVYGGYGADDIITIGHIVSDSTVVIDAGRNANDTCYTGVNDIHNGSYQTIDCENSGNLEFTDFDPVE